MSQIGKRGIAKCENSDKSNPNHTFTIEFNERGIPVGDNEPRFTSWFGCECKTRLPYHLEMKKMDKTLFEQLWLHTKQTWHIADDIGKNHMKKKASDIMRKFRFRLVQDYVKKDLTPFSKYSYVDKNFWPAFVEKARSENFLTKSEKSKISARQNKDPTRLGRTTLASLTHNSKWEQLVAQNPVLGSITNLHSKLWIVSRSQKNIETGIHEIASDIKGRLDALVQKERDMPEVETLQGDLARLQAAQGSGVRGSSCASDEPHNDFEDIEETTQCDLLWPFTDDDTRVARGLVYPTRDRILHGRLMASGFVKVQVDTVEIDYKKMFVLSETQTDEVVRLEDAIYQFIQWPRKSIRIENMISEQESISRPTHISPTHLQNPSMLHQPIGDIATSSCYRPQMEEHEQTMPQFQRQTNEFMAMLQ